jgi:serine/threonine-protein kinase
MLGMSLGGYVIEARIGEGGMGLVYRAVQPLIRKQVAIKVLSPQLASRPEEVDRLLAEARIVNAIRHRGIIDIFSFGQLPDGRQYMIMEYLHGTPLDAYLRQRGRLELAEALPLLDEVLAALGAAHSAGVIHRDIKPSNVFLVEQVDGTRYVKLLDFGIAKAEALSEEAPQTMPGRMVGTPYYMAPEQVRSEAVSPQTDLYALGVLGFKLLTGQLPFTGRPHQVVMAQVEQAPPAPSHLVPELPPAVDALILSLLAKLPEQRPASAEQVRRSLAALRESLGKTPEAGPALPSLTRPLPALSAPRGREETLELAAPARGQRAMLSRSGPWRWVAAVGGLLGLGGTVLGGLHRASPPPEEEEESISRPGTPASAEQPVAPPLPEPEAAPAAAPAEQRPEEPASPSPAVQAVPKRSAEKPRAALPVAAAAPSPRALLARLEQLEQAYQQRVSEGEKPNPLAQAFLEKARRDVEQARTSEARRELERYLDDWEQRFLRK